MYKSNHQYPQPYHQQDQLMRPHPHMLVVFLLVELLIVLKDWVGGWFVY